MDGKELYEALDTVWAALPDDAARQQFAEVVRVLNVEAPWRLDLGMTTTRWYGQVTK
ncbi:MAG TPA: hypothetical protein VFB74_33955 [Kribbellaceae bacterium]|nr:hypothetical protein [Kribbellaceae bacterium]